MDLDLGHIIQTPVSRLNEYLSESLVRIYLENKIHEFYQKKHENNKSPDSDGYTVDFLNLFWVDLKEFILKSINCIPIFQRLGIV